MPKRKPTTKPKRDLYQETTDKIIERMEASGLPPWRMPIVTHGENRFPSNYASGKEYRGANVFFLSMAAWAEGYDASQWLTFKQAKDKGGCVRKGEKGHLVTFWKTYTKTDEETAEETVLPVLRHYTVFNLDQVDGIEPAEPVQTEAGNSLIASAEAIATGFQGGPIVEQKGHRAVYYPSVDRVQIAPMERFASAEDFYATLFHEFGHATGHESRLNRGNHEPHVFGSADYSKEELVAEMTSAFLCAAAGISPATVDQSAAYLRGWMKSLKDDKKLLIAAAGKAQRAADLVRGITFD